MDCFHKMIHYIEKHPKIFALISILFTSKIIISALTPLSDDFLSILLFAYSGTYPGPHLIWILIMRAMYKLWLLIPIDHLSVPEFIGFWYFKPTLPSLLLVSICKIPHIIFDIACAIFLYKIVFETTHSYNASLYSIVLWVANPYVILVTEMFGAYDVAVTFFYLLSTYFFIKHKYILAAFSVLFSIVLKPYPLVLLPLFVIILAKQRRSKEMLKFILTIVLLSSTIFLVASVAIIPNSISGLIKYYLTKGISFSQGFMVEIPGTPVALSLTFLFFTIFIFMAIGFWNFEVDEKIIDLSLCTLLILFAFSFWHPQYLMLIIPFLTFDYVRNRIHLIYPIGYILTAFVALLFYFGFYFSSLMNSVFFIPNYTSELQMASNFLYSLHQNEFWRPIATITRSIFTGISIVYLYKIFMRNLARPIRA